MNLIEKLGGFEKAKDILKIRIRAGFIDSVDELEKALLDYRREHNIFEVGDEVVYVDDFMPNSVSVVSEVNNRVWLNDNNAVCIKEMIKHATDDEIMEGRRL